MTILIITKFTVMPSKKCSDASKLPIAVFAFWHPTSFVLFALGCIRTLVVEKGLASLEPPQHVVR
jgi:hypothetical protein